MGSNRIAGLGQLLVLTVLASCNGGIGGTGGNDDGSNPDISVGTITALGSTKVNGVTFDTATATVVIDENNSMETDLKKGMVVEIRGSIDSETTGIAASVVAENAAKGPITDMLPGDDSQIEVLGQRVEIDETTILTNSNDDQLTIANFANNDLVRVSGFVKAHGVIAASRIKKETVLNDYRIKGFVENKLGASLTMGNQLVDCSASDASDLPGGAPANDMLIEIKASITLGAGGELIATRLELEDIRNSEGSEIELEGYITDASGAPGTFFIGSQEVQTNGATLFKGGLASDIRFGIEVEAEGLISGGILIADEIEFEPNTEVEADTMAVDAGAGTITLALGGLVVTTNADTEIETLSGTGNSLSDLNAMGGNHLLVKGNFEVGSGNIVAKKIEEKPAPDTSVQLRGPVTNNAGMTSIEIIGVTVTPDVTAEYRDEVKQAVADLATFKGLLAVGSIVKAESDQNAPILWNKLSLEY